MTIALFVSSGIFLLLYIIPLSRMDAGLLAAGLYDNFINKTLNRRLFISFILFMLGLWRVLG